MDWMANGPPQHGGYYHFYASNNSWNYPLSNTHAVWPSNPANFTSFASLPWPAYHDSKEAVVYQCYDEGCCMGSWSSSTGQSTPSWTDSGNSNSNHDFGHAIGQGMTGGWDSYAQGSLGNTCLMAEPEPSSPASEDLPVLSEVDTTELITLLEAAQECRRRRIEGGLSQEQMGRYMRIAGHVEFSQTTVSRFENCKLSRKNMTKLKPVLEEVLDLVAATGISAVREAFSTSGPAKASAHSSTTKRQRNKRTVVDNGVTRRLHEIFLLIPTPTQHEIDQMAGMFKLEPRYVRRWFNNRRSRTKRNGEISMKNFDIMKDESLSTAIGSINVHAGLTMCLPESGDA